MPPPAALAIGAFPVIGNALRKIILSPYLSGPLLGLAIYLQRNQNGADELAGQFPILQSLLAPDTLPSIRNKLAVIFGLSLLDKLGDVLNVMASNSWRLRPSTGWEWPKEVAVVTGAASGIGLDIAKQLAKAGVRVAVFDIQNMPKDVEATPGISFYHCDITSKDSISTAAAAVRRDLGHPSILVNNAGYTDVDSIVKTSETALRRTFDVNCIGMWFMTQEFLPHMVEQDKGYIVTMASVASFMGLPLDAKYGMTKASAIAFHEVLTGELKHVHKVSNVVTSIVHPNFVRTPMIKDFEGELVKRGVDILSSEHVAVKVVDQIKSKRGGQLVIPSDMAFVSGIRGWSVWMQQLFRDTLGGEVVTINFGQSDF